MSKSSWLKRLFEWRMLLVPIVLVILQFAVLRTWRNNAAPERTPQEVAEELSSEVMLGDEERVSIPAITASLTIPLSERLATNPFALPDALQPMHSEPDESLIVDTPPAPLESAIDNAARQPDAAFATNDECIAGTDVDLPAKPAIASIAPPPCRPELSRPVRVRPQAPVPDPEVTLVAPKPVVRVFSLKYLTRADVEPVLPELLSTIGKSKFAIAAESQTEMLVIDDPDSLLRVENYLAQADRAPPHVIIDAHVLQVGLLGGAWQGLDLQPLATEFGGTSTSDGPQHYVRFAGGKTAAVLARLQSSMGAQLLASPQLLALQGQSASVQVGAHAAMAGTVTSGFGLPFDRGVELQVTPRVTGDGAVMLHIQPEIADGQINPLSGIADAALDTTVLLSDGEAILISGLIHQRDVEYWTKRPILGDLPVIGPRFQQRYIVPTRTEVLIVLSPRIVPTAADVPVAQH